MSEENPNPAPEPNDSEETGEPIAELGELEQDTSPFFLRNLRRRIHRRQAASQIVSASWDLPRIVFVELANVLIRILSASGARKGD